MMQRAKFIGIVVLTGINAGVTGKFISTLFAKPAQYIVDWSPAVYWILGILIAAAGASLARSKAIPVSESVRSALLIVNGLCFTTYISIAFFLFWNSFSRLT